MLSRFILRRLFLLLKNHLRRTKNNNFEEFKQQVMEDLPGALPERLSNVEIEPVSVTKLQHGSYDGITIREEGSNIGMNLDLSGLFERMEKGTAYDEVLAEAVAIISNATAQAPKIDVDRLMDEVAKELHLTKGRVCQIEKVIMRKLKMFFETH